MNALVFGFTIFTASDSHSGSNYALQVRANGQVFEYCGTLSHADYGQTPTAGTLVTTFTVQ